MFHVLFPNHKHIQAIRNSPETRGAYHNADSTASDTVHQALVAYSAAAMPARRLRAPMPGLRGALVQLFIYTGRLTLTAPYHAQPPPAPPEPPMPPATSAAALTSGRLKRLSSMPSSPALTAHTTCLRLIARKERARGGRPYSWVMRLRSDAVHAVPLPPYSLWPAASGKLVYTPSCHGNTTAAPWNSECGDAPGTVGRVCSRVSYRRHWAHARDGSTYSAFALGCVSDLWALMTRSAAEVYFDRHLLLNAVAIAAERKLTCGNSLWWNECFLGCALHAHDVEVREVQAKWAAAKWAETADDESRRRRND